MIRVGVCAGLFAVTACSAVIGVRELAPGPYESDASSSTDASDERAVDGAVVTDGAAKDGSARCDGGLCTPTPLTSSEIDLDELSVARDRVLYRAAEHVQSVSLDGGLASLLVSCADRAGLVATDAGFYSWCVTNITRRDLFDGGVLASAVVDGHEGALGGGTLFFASGSTLIERLPDTLGDASFVDVGVSSGGFGSMATNASDFFVMSQDGTLSHAPFGVDALTELEHGQTSPTPIAVDDRGVFWATDRDGDQAVLHARVLSGGATTPIATGLDHPFGLAVDDDYVYVALRGTPPQYTNGKIVRVPRGGGAVETLAQGIIHPYRIALTSDAIVFTSRGTSPDGGPYAGGAIYRLPK